MRCSRWNGCSRASPRECAPIRSPRRSARASRPRTTCSPASSRRASPPGARGASTRSPPTSGGRSPPHPSCTICRRSSTICSRARTSAPISRCRSRVTSAWWSSGASRGCSSCRGWDRRSETTPMPSRSARSCSPSLPRRQSSATSRPACADSQPARSPGLTPSGPSCAGSAGPGSPADCEEFDQDFCCLAAPVLDHRHRFVGAVGISMTRRAFEDERPALEETLRDVARFQPSAEKQGVLDPDPGSVLASAGESTVR